MEHITTLETAPHIVAVLPQPTPYQWATYVRSLAGKPIPVVTAPSGEVLAYINWSRWVADCPFCQGAEVVSRRLPVFYCASCGMERNGGAPARVIFPADADQIEAVLLCRPVVATRNWLPHEAVTRLQAENDALLAHAPIVAEN